MYTIYVIFAERRGVPLLQAHSGQRAPRHPLDGDAVGQAAAGHVGKHALKCRIYMV